MVILVGTPSSCPGADENHRIAQEIGVTTSGGILVVQGVYLDTWCGPASVELFQATAVDSQPPVDVYRVKINAPDFAMRGQTLIYTVQIVNVSGTARNLAPCPSYTESLLSGVVTVAKTLLLNCASVARLSPGDGATFEMKFEIASDFPVGGAKLSWKLESAEGALSAASLAVR
jgi:hypothetical protein